MRLPILVNLILTHSISHTVSKLSQFMDENRSLCVFELPSEAQVQRTLFILGWFESSQWDSYIHVINWTFFVRCYGWGATSEYWMEISVCERGGSVSAEFSRSMGLPPRTIFPVNALQLCWWQYSHKEILYQTSFKWGAILDGKRPFCVFEPPLGGNVRWSS